MLMGDDVQARKEFIQENAHEANLMLKNKMENNEMPKVGEKYKHFKGGEYEIVAVALDCENPERKLVIYKNLHDKENFPAGTIWVRELEEFIGFKELNGEKIKRFVKI